MTYRTEFFNLNAIILGKINCIGAMLRYAYPRSFPRFLKIGKWGSDDKEMSHSSGASYAPTIVHASRKDNERREDKCILATCGIWKHIPRQSGKFIGTGSLIKDFFPRCDKKIHLVTSDKVISSDDLSCYYLYFKKSKYTEKGPKRLLGMVSDKVIFKSGLSIVPIDPNKRFLIKNRKPWNQNFRSAKLN